MVGSTAVGGMVREMEQGAATGAEAEAGAGSGAKAAARAEAAAVCTTTSTPWTAARHATRVEGSHTVTSLY